MGAPTSAAGVGRYLVIEALVPRGSRADLRRSEVGVVARAYDTKLRREVALRSVRSTQLSPQSHARLLSHAQAMARLSHPNVVALYDVSLEDGDVVIAMEFVRGAPLDVWLSQSRSWREVLAHFVSAGRGLAAAHAAGLAHGDFSASKVLIGEDRRVRVTDFALSELVTEQDDSGALTPVVDQHAFCAALFEGLTGQSAFGGEPHAMQERAERPQWPRTLSVPVAVRRAIDRGLSSDERWPSMNALLDALERAATPARRGTVAAGGMLLALCVSGVAWAHRERADRYCSGAATQLIGMWDPQRRESVQQALAATDVPYASDVWQRVAPQLDAYASAWTATHTDACEATTVRGEQPTEVLDLRMACLHRAAVDLRAAVNLLSRADAQIVEKAHQLVGSLPALERCSDLEALRAEVTPPDAAEVSEVESIRVELASVRALREAGKYSDALRDIQDVALRAKDIAYRPLQTEVMMQLGWAHENAGAFPEAEAAFKRALSNAVAARQWREAVAAATSLVHTVGSSQTRPIEAHAYAETAKALLVPDDLHAQADLRGFLGAALDEQGLYAEAEVEHRTALALAEQSSGGNHPDVAQHRANLGLNLGAQGRLDEAERELRVVLKIREQTLGPDHPETTRARFDLANNLHMHGRYADAEAAHRAALLTWEKTLGRDHLETALTRHSMANAIAKQGRAAEAATEFQEALRVEVAVLGPDHINVGVTQTSLGVVLAKLGRYAEAEANLREAIANHEKAYGRSHPHVARAVSSLSTVLLHQERYEEAETVAREALAIFAQSAGYEHQGMLQARHNLGLALRGQRRWQKAAAELRTALDVGRKTMGPAHPNVEAIEHALVSTLEALGRHDEARDVANRELTFAHATPR